MKRFLPLAAALLLATGCNLRTATYSDEQATPLGEGQTDSLLQSVSIEYPVKGAKAEVLAKIEDGILNTVFDMEELPGTVEETALRYEDNLKDEYFNEYEGQAGGSGARTWEDHVNGYFSGRYKQFLSYMVEIYSFRGGVHGINATAGTGRPILCAASRRRGSGSCGCPCPASQRMRDATNTASTAA